MKLPKIPIQKMGTSDLAHGYQAIGHYHNIIYFVSLFRDQSTGLEWWCDSDGRPRMLTHISPMPEFVEQKEGE